MIIECPACHARYQIAQSIKPPGRKVRCGKCTEVWWVDAAGDGEPAEAAPVASPPPAPGHAGHPGLATQSDWETARAARMAAEAARAQVNTMRLGTPQAQRAEAPAFSYQPDVSPPDPQAKEVGGTPHRAPAPPPPPLQPSRPIAAEYEERESAPALPAPRPSRPTFNWPPEPQPREPQPGPRPGPIRIGAAEDRGRPGLHAEHHPMPPPPASRGASVVPSPAAEPDDDEREPEPESDDWTTPSYAEPQRRSSWRSVLGSLVVILSAVGVLAYAVFARHQVVRWLPAASGVYAALGLPMSATTLVVRNVKAEWLTETNAPLLVVRGEVFNPARHEQPAPAILLELRDAADRSIFQTTVRAGSVTVSKGGMTRFVARIPPPSATVASVSVRLR